MEVFTSTILQNGSGEMISLAKVKVKANSEVIHHLKVKVISELVHHLVTFIHP
jgi:hypothetical protein